MSTLKVLIVTNLRHSSPRIPGLARYLPEYGVQVTVITPPVTTSGRWHGAPPADVAGSMRLIEAPHPESSRSNGTGRPGAGGRTGRGRLGAAYLLLRKLVRLFREVAWFPDRDRRWIPVANRVAAELLARERFDILLTSSSPVSCHVVGSRLATKYHVPWVAEFRDLWSQNHAYPHSSIRRWIERRYEIRTLAPARALVTVAEALAVKLRQLHKKPTDVIHNGFDSAAYREPTPLTRKLTITYTGQIYEGKQDPRKICRALRDLIDARQIEPNQIEVRFYGPFSEALQRAVADLRLEATIIQHGVVSPAEAVQRQKESHLLLMFNWEDSSEKGIYTQKIFEYLGSRRPMIATGGRHDGDVREELIVGCNAGKYCTTHEEIRDALSAWFQVFRELGPIPPTTDESAISAYEYRTLAEKYAGIFTKAAGIST